MHITHGKIKKAVYGTQSICGLLSMSTSFFTFFISIITSLFLLHYRLRVVITHYVFALKTLRVVNILQK